MDCCWLFNNENNERRVERVNWEILGVSNGPLKFLKHLEVLAKYGLCSIFSDVPNFKEDHLSVEVRLPTGQSQKPVSGQHLYWIKPGKRPEFRYLSVHRALVGNHKITIGIVDLPITTGTRVDKKTSRYKQDARLA